jgi:hypothetical protein
VSFKSLILRGLLIAGTLGLLWVLFIVALWMGAFKPRFQYTKSQTVQEGPFFRVDVKLDYKGKPHDISYVATCQARITRYADNSRSYDVGLTPNVYGHRMEDGQAVLVNTPQVCNGETTTNKWVPENWMPMIVVYEDATLLSFGRAYMTEDAYASPLSELKFHKATITAATRQEFDDFARTGPKNVVTRERFFSNEDTNFQKRAGALKQYDEVFSDSCLMVVRYRVSEEKRAVLRKMTGYAANESWNHVIYEELSSFYRAGTFSNDKDDTQYKSSEVNTGSRMGIMREARNSMINDPQFQSLQKRFMFPSIYPVNSPVRQGKRPPELTALGQTLPGEDAFIGYNTEIEPAKQGFAYCYPNPPIISKAYKDDRPKVLWAQNGRRIRNDDGQNRGSNRYFEGDEFYVITAIAKFRTHGGDVK